MYEHTCTCMGQFFVYVYVIALCHSDIIMSFLLGGYSRGVGAFG